MKTLTRNGLIAKIKIAQKQLDMVDDAYRAMLVRVTGKDSCAKMGVPELEKVAEEMKRMGFVPLAKSHGTRPRRRSSADPMMRKIEALLASMALHWNYAHALAKRMYGVARVEWLTDEHMRGVIAALTKKQQKIKGEGNGA